MLVTPLTAGIDEDALLVESMADVEAHKKMMKYVRAHPELNLIVAELYDYILANKPPKIAKYAAEQFFGNPAVIAEWTSKIGIVNTAERS